MHRPMSDHDMTQQPITAQPRCGASSHVSRATLWLVNNKPPWKIWPNKLFKIFEERWQTIAYDRVQELIDSRQSKKPVSFLMLSLWATRFSRWPVVMLLRNRGRDWWRPPKKTRPDTWQSSHGRLGRSSNAKTARNSKMWPTDQPTDRHGKV